MPTTSNDTTAKLATTIVSTRLPSIWPGVRLRRLNDHVRADFAFALEDAALGLEDFVFEVDDFAVDVCALEAAGASDFAGRSALVVDAALFDGALPAKTVRASVLAGDAFTARLAGTAAEYATPSA
jgi:hypothetical protein